MSSDDTLPTIIGDPSHGVRRPEAWTATTPDGLWRLDRNDDVHTAWQITHLPSTLTIAELYSTQRAARRTITAGTVLLQLWLTARTVLHPGTATDIPVDVARAAIDWLHLHHPQAGFTGACQVMARLRRDAAARVRAVAEDVTARAVTEEEHALAAAHHRYAYDLLEQADNFRRAAAAAWQDRNA